MSKNIKIIIICILCLIACFLFSMCSCSEDIAKIVSGEDGLCDYCGKKAGIGQDTKEYCAECFNKYDGDIWH